MKTNKKKAIRMGLAVTAAALFWGGMYLLFGNDAAQKMEWNQVKDYAPDSEVCETLDEAVAETGNIPVVATCILCIAVALGSDFFGFCRHLGFGIEII